MTTPAQRLEHLEKRAAAIWAEILDSSRFVRRIREGKADKALYSIYLAETYHYTRHNSRNQAVVGVRMTEANPQYQKFCFKHATEETGHELMALHDMLSILGIKKDEMEMPEPLPETETLMAYLYWVSLTGSPYQRLGYSFWAENSYEHINPLIAQIRETLALKTTQMTFFMAHSEIDEHHAEEVERILAQNCKTDKEWAAVERVMETSLRLTGEMLEGVYREYQKVITGAPSPYAFLKAHV